MWKRDKSPEKWQLHRGLLIAHLNFKDIHLRMSADNDVNEATGLSFSSRSLYGGIDHGRIYTRQLI
ncbi:hypothetical protein COMA1_10430 [Candidatus Nitrospira nitrosa]|uniref:Uncharacterized protein n=1 Tax=Candidatus Nitrospira nitrosa TaxID=1742972 RepID=A0A0S4L5Q1_9BACT|nr:hypothetical protein COMA1_10430 [Candidatus Nitrospira nitrosa]